MVSTSTAGRRTPTDQASDQTACAQGTALKSMTTDLIVGLKHFTVYILPYVMLYNHRDRDAENIKSVFIRSSWAHFGTPTTES